MTGSVDAIRALNEGRCSLAGFHTLEQPLAGSLAQRTYKPLLQPGLHKVIGFARRWQGLMVARGNPLSLKALGDLRDSRVRFVNRELGSGTRVLLDSLLAQQAMTPAQLAGYGQCEPSHAAVAQAVASGQADCGLGIASAAQARGLDFVPLVQERYHLVCLKTALAQAPTLSLLQLLKSPAWQRQLGQVAGTTPAQCGEVLSLRALLPWWNFRRPKV